ncbi:MAG: hypothetical protein GY859_39540 [Desulfobacterales bacterium]|nr:hypothetical protein [Desulfobacterales bacterium]
MVEMSAWLAKAGGGASRAVDGRQWGVRWGVRGGASGVGRQGWGVRGCTPRVSGGCPGDEVSRESVWSRDAGPTFFDVASKK